VRPSIVALGLIALLMTTIGTSASLDRRNPARRDAATWTALDARALFEDDALHFCGHHGHSSGRGPAWMCKGRVQSVMADLERRAPRSLALETLIVELVDHRDRDVACRAPRSPARGACAWALARLDGRDPGPRPHAK
jgi:hypothetical protein